MVGGMPGWVVQDWRRHVITQKLPLHSLINPRKLPIISRGSQMQHYLAVYFIVAIFRCAKQTCLRLSPGCASFTPKKIYERSFQILSS
jgi:hypothetical protein